MESCFVEVDIDFSLLRVLVREDEEGMPIQEIPEGDCPMVKPISLPNTSILGRRDGEMILLNTPRIAMEGMGRMIQLASDNVVVGSFQSSVQTELAKVLAHEVGHWQLARRYPNLHLADVKIYEVLGWVLRSAVGFGLAWFAIWSFSIWANSISSLLAAAFWAIWMGSILGGWTRRSPVIEARLIYRIAWTERFARRFSLRAESDPRWQKACKVIVRSVQSEPGSL